MKDVIRVNNRFYVLATSSLADDRTRVLKYGETFAVFNSVGDIEPVGLGQQGLYHRDTRYLSRYVLRLGGKAPQLLRSTIREDNAFLTVDMMNLDVLRDAQIFIPRGTVHVFRSKFLSHDICYEQVRLANYGLELVELSISFQYEADFADIFQVRGTPRTITGTRFPSEARRDTVKFLYQGRDGHQRGTAIQFSPMPTRVSAKEATFAVSLKRREEVSIFSTICCNFDNRPRNIRPFSTALHTWTRTLEEAANERCQVTTSNHPFNAWLARSDADLVMMLAGNPEGAYPYAGVPWFSTVFGRDGLITARECLSFAPGVAHSVLHYLATTQATEVDPAREAEPGKILHEMRRSEMAETKEVPFARYYGSIDATPLFVMLAGAYWERTADLDLIRAIWPNILAALDWIDTYGDRDGDGYIEYQSHNLSGLIQQGWKDSRDSIFYRDGTIARPPIALCEVQGYVYAARRAAARLADALGDFGRAETLRTQAESLRQAFERDFWIDSLGTYAIALDGEKKPCEVQASNAGHGLFTEIIAHERAARVMQNLLGPELFCGWGVRTLGSKEVRYNPMAYHNGTVWPHDNALIARGLANYGFHDAVLDIIDGLFEASTFMDLHRLPELFCGFHRRHDDEGPTLYPVACSPQAWAAGAVYLLLESCLGLQIRPQQRAAVFHSPRLPRGVDQLRIESLHVNGAAATLVLRRGSQDAVHIDSEGAAQDLSVEVLA
jgi:glycogen debranching enzyme